MRRTMLLCAVLAIACSSADNAATADSASKAASMAPPPPPAITLADVAGTWEGTITAVGNDTVLATQLLKATADTTGWTLTVSNTKTPPKTVVVVPTHVAASGDSIVIDGGPFDSVLRAGEKVSIHSIFRLQSGMLVGMIHATYPNGEMVMLRSTAARKP